MKSWPITFRNGVARRAKAGDPLFVKEGYSRFRPFRNDDTSVACLREGYVINVPIREVDTSLVGDFPDRVLTPKECECGKDKHGFFAHSTWCPKYA
jgi:hypothetical protein